MAKQADKDRPLGLLMQWLSVGTCVDAATHATSSDLLHPSFDRRKMYRERLLAEPGAMDLFKYERGYNPDAPDYSEPDFQF